MAHLIGKTDSMVSGRGQIPWHKLGEVVPGNVPLETLERHIGWNVELEPLVTKRGEPTTTYATIRKDFINGVFTRIVLGDKLGEGYGLFTNRQLLKIVKRFQEQGCAIETGGSLREGKRVWVLMRLQSDLIVGQNDRIETYVLLSNDFTGTESVKIGTVGIRVVCNNTLTWAESSENSKLIRIAHTKNVTEAVEDVVNLMDTANGGFLSYGEDLEALAKKGINQNDLNAYVKRIFFPKLELIEDDKEKAKQADKLATLQRQINEAFESGPGSDLDTAKGTVYGAYQAVNHYLNHSKGRSSETRLTGLVFGGNQGVLDRKAFKEALALTKG